MKTVDDYIIVQMGDFMLNAGILGLIRALENYHAVEGRDYIIGENELRLSKDYLETTDLDTENLPEPGMENDIE